MLKVKIFGLERTCTNYLHWLLRNNYYDLELLQLYEGGWKHGLPHNLSEDTKTILCVKHPYAWMVSLYKWDQNAQLGGLSFKTYVMSGQPIFKWNTMLRAWLNTINPTIVRYEDLLDNPEKECDRIAGEVGFKKKGYGFVTPGEKKLDYNTYTAPTLQFNKGYYENKEYMDCYDNEMVDFIKSHIDYELLELFKYEL